MTAKKKHKIGIVYFDDKHIIPHFLGPVKEFYNDPDLEVEIITYEGKHSYLHRLLEAHNLPQNIVKKLPTYWYRKISEKLKSRKIPSPLYLFKKHKKYLLENFDALIFNDINHEYLHKYKTGNSPKFILLMHGAGDGEYMIGKSYEKSIAKFDLITTSGKKITDFYQKMDLPNTKVEICGYQKFDLIDSKNIPDFFKNDKPVVIYNPHFKREFSSWYLYGLDILEFFYQQKDYNLIFAPHINLFNKRGFLKPDIIPDKYFKAENILIDFDSEHLVNMDYTLAANIYLGDLSSQIYEFLYQLKPAIFINTHKENWENNPHYRHWQAGPLITDIQPLKKLLDTHQNWHQKYIDKQEQIRSYTFENIENNTASKKIAKAVKKLLIN